MPHVEIHIQGKIDTNWSEWFEDLTVIQLSTNETALSGYLADRSAVYGILSRLSSLGLALISVQCNYSKDDTK